MTINVSKNLFINAKFVEKSIYKNSIYIKKTSLYVKTRKNEIKRDIKWEKHIFKSINMKKNQKNNVYFSFYQIAFL